MPLSQHLRFHMQRQYILEHQMLVREPLPSSPASELPDAFGRLLLEAECKVTDFPLVQENHSCICITVLM